MYITYILYLDVVLSLDGLPLICIFTNINDRSQLSEQLSTVWPYLNGAFDVNYMCV